MTKFNLSEKIITGSEDECLWTEDVKEFIRLLKEKINLQIKLAGLQGFNPIDTLNELNKLAGPRLTK